MFDHFAKHAEFNFLLAFNVDLGIFCCVAQRRGDGHWTGQLRGNPVELEDFPRVIDIYCEQSGRSLKFTSKQDPPWQESRISGKIGRKAVGSIFHLHLQSHNKRYSDITAQSHVIGQETKFRDLIFILLFGHPIAYPYLMWESGDSVSLLLEIKSSMLRNAWDS